MRQHFTFAPRQTFSQTCRAAACTKKQPAERSGSVASRCNCHISVWAFLCNAHVCVRVQEESLQFEINVKSEGHYLLSKIDKTWAVGIQTYAIFGLANFILMLAVVSFCPVLHPCRISAFPGYLTFVDIYIFECAPLRIVGQWVGYKRGVRWERQANKTGRLWPAKKKKSLQTPPKKTLRIVTTVLS